MCLYGVMIRQLLPYYFEPGTFHRILIQNIVYPVRRIFVAIGKPCAVSGNQKCIIETFSYLTVRVWYRRIIEIAANNYRIGWLLNMFTQCISLSCSFNKSLTEWSGKNPELLYKLIIGSGRDILKEAPFYLFQPEWLEMIIINPDGVSTDDNICKNGQTRW